MNRPFHLLFVTGMLLFTRQVFAQNVAINEDGSVANAHAILDLKSPNKGVLIPRMSTTARIAIPNTSGLLVYDSTVGAFFYNNGTFWQSLATGNTTGWLLNGNSGTGKSSFLGTTDTGAMVIKVHNVSSGNIDPFTANTFWGFGSGSATVATPATGLGMYNTSIGSAALQSNQTGVGNAALGYAALESNIIGSSNTAIGRNALATANSDFNTAVGAGAMSDATNAGSNTAIGANALRSTMGNLNAAIGVNALIANTIGSGNTATGSESLPANTTGNSNTANGFNSMGTNTTGSNNTVIGAGADVSTSNLSNATAIGSGAIVNASNKVRIGNSAVTVIEGQVPFTTPSDGRFKYQVREDVKGLDFILQLRPVTYQFDVKRFDQNIRRNDKDTVPVNYAIQAAYNEASMIRRSGFIAQEVEKAADGSGYNFSGIIKPKTEEDHYSLSYEAFVVPLVKAVQELNAEVERLRKENASMRSEMNDLKKEVRH